MSQGNILLDPEEGQRQSPCLRRSLRTVCPRCCSGRRWFSECLRGSRSERKAAPAGSARCPTWGESWEALAWQDASLSSVSESVTALCVSELKRYFPFIYFQESGVCRNKWKVNSTTLHPITSPAPKLSLEQGNSECSVVICRKSEMHCKCMS